MDRCRLGNSRISARRRPVRDPSVQVPGLAGPAHRRQQEYRVYQCAAGVREHRRDPDPDRRYGQGVAGRLDCRPEPESGAADTGRGGHAGPRPLVSGLFAFSRRQGRSDRYGSRHRRGPLVGIHVIGHLADHGRNLAVFVRGSFDRIRHTAAGRMDDREEQRLRRLYVCSQRGDLVEASGQYQATAELSEEEKVFTWNTSQPFVFIHGIVFNSFNCEH